MLKSFQALIEKHSLLANVHYRMLSEKLVSQIEFEFADRSTAVVYVDEDTDELVVEREGARQDPRMNVSGKPPWNSAIGKPIFWVWTLINQSGFQDGLQIEFGFTVHDSHCVVQLQGAASTLEVLEVAPLHGGGAEVP